MLVASAGGVVVLMALVTLRLVGWPVDGQQSAPYRGETWFVTALLLGSGLAAVFVRRWSRPAITVAAVCALQLVGTGIVAHRRWFTSAGFGAVADNLDELRTIAALVSVVASIAAAAACATLWLTRESLPLAWRRLVAGAAVAVLAPLAMGWETFSRTTQIGGHGLLYGTWGVGVALAALLAPNHRRAVDLALVACGVATLLSGPMIPAPRTWLGVVVLVIAVAVVGVGDQRDRVARSNSSAVSGVAEANV